MRLWPFTLLLCGCVGLPDQVQPVGDFEAERYLGTWYEIARLDHSFERGLQQVSASYSPREDGGIRVINRGYKTGKARWQEAEGKAYLMGDPDVGHLKVSFFGPFYASYVIFDLDPLEQTAFVAGNSHDYLWLLARTPQISEQAKQRFIRMARDRGFAVDELIWVEQAETRS